MQSSCPTDPSEAAPPHGGDTAAMSRLPVLVTGATGYVGGRLVPRLLDAGYRVRCLARSAPKLAARTWASNPRVEIREADLADTDAVADAMRGCGAAYYLVHSMLSTGVRYADVDRRLARSFATAAARAGIARIIYLGGLGGFGDPEPPLSEHLASRREVEAVLAAAPVPVTVLRAAMIIGSGSASFEILRYLVERLPVMVTPRWVKTASQPIAIGDVLTYLVACLSVPATAGRTLDIGGPEIVTYLDLMRIMAEERGLRPRLVIPVPVLTPRLSSLWIHLVTPVSHRIARPLAEGLRNPVICRDDEAMRLMPQRLLGVRAAIRVALEQIVHGTVETDWSDAGPIPGDPDWAGGTVFTDRRETEIAASPADVFATVSRIGGTTGWYGADRLWRVRGALDRLAGGPGLRRGRRDAQRVAFGDAIDVWRVTGIAPGRRLALRAEMRVPGEARLEFAVEPLPGCADRCRLVQTATFRPRGLLGLAYWYAVLPLHGFVFARMLAGIGRAAERMAYDERRGAGHVEVVQPVTMSARVQIAGLVAWVAVTAAAAALGAVASAAAPAVYVTLARPAWAPPPAVFGPVWTVLYLLMAVAAWLVWRTSGVRRARWPLGLYVGQLALNALWTWLFFRWRLVGVALVEILGLALVIAATLAGFYRVRPLAGLLLAPYLAWVIFAGVLTAAIWRAN